MVKWDRLFETCFRRGTDLLLIPGTPPMLRVAGVWRVMSIPALMSDEVQQLASELLEGKEAEAETGHNDGYVYRDIRYGEDATFRLLAFGYPSTKAIIATQRPLQGEHN